MRSPELQSINLASCFAGRKIRELIDCITLDTHVTRHGGQTRAVTTRASVRLAFVDPFRFALGGDLCIQNRFSVWVGTPLHILFLDLADSAALSTRAWRR